MFDAIQTAHLTESHNIADRDVLGAIARDIGLDFSRFASDLESPEALERVEDDRRRARDLGISSIPTILALPGGMKLQTMPLEDLRRRLNEIAASTQR